MKTFLASLMILTLAAAARGAEADTPKFPATEQFISEKLDGVADLSTEQRDKIRTLLREQFPSLKKLVTKYVDELRALHETIGSPTVDEKAIRAQTTKLADVLVDYTKQRAQLAASLKGVLTPEQLDKAQQDVSTNLAKFVDEIAKLLAKE